MSGASYRVGDKVLVQVGGVDNIWGGKPGIATITRIGKLWGQTPVYYIDVQFGTEPIIHGVVYEEEIVGCQIGAS